MNALLFISRSPRVFQVGNTAGVSDPRIERRSRWRADCGSASSGGCARAFGIGRNKRQFENQKRPNPT